VVRPAGPGLRRLALNWLDGPRHIIGAVAYPRASDLRGVAIRVPPVEAWRRTFEPLGAIPTTVEFAEVYSALSQGVVAAAEGSLTTVQSARWYEVAKEITLTGHFQPFNGWVMSEAVFAELSAEDQAILVAEFLAGGVAHSRADEARVAQLVTELRGQGVNFTEADLESYRQGTASYYQGVPGWPEGLIDEVRATIAG